MASAPIDQESAKAQQIVHGAKEAFLDLGFEGASVDTIAKRAGVSKATLYKYFPDKSTLFAAVIGRECRALADQVFTPDYQHAPIEPALRHVARSVVDFMMAPELRRLARVAIAEADRFPEVGRLFFEHGPDLGHRRLSGLLAAGVAQGQLEVEDVEVAAAHFMALCRAELFFKLLLHVQHETTADERRAIADRAVDTFLAAFAPR